MDITLKNINYNYGSMDVLEHFNYKFKDNSFTAIKGKSGSGKSTLLNIIGLISNPNNGEVYYDDKVVSSCKYRKRIKYYRYYLSFIFQDFLLLPELSVEKNLSISANFITEHKKKKNIYIDALKKVGLGNIDIQRPVNEFSGGEQQRIAIARSFIKPCKLILADEPTGSLDYNNSKNIMDLLKLLQSLGKTIIMVTHSNKFDEYFDNVVHLD
ncbi:ATP-binding cassette domain-containing protein [Apilactobacillus timberlakei]|uniref:ATP-binding cassette domain-containing protein n=1 Tax=Apilactobacillus timberlakei TaxID=2008380 RepID=UPI00112C639A|nr:ATP-binding cassette domain-containing protein [Apilactobacillus timberlakei]TPR12151.1 ATP-binding cassette domain-containing protein [Apilactobacillus timberlakei]